MEFTGYKKTKNMLRIIWMAAPLIVAIIYLLCELSINFTLIDMYGETAMKSLMSEGFAYNSMKLEVIGRYVTGFGLAYILSSIFHTRFVKKLPFNGKIKGITTIPKSTLAYIELENFLNEVSILIKIILLLYI